MAYMWPQSLTPWLDPYGDPYSGAKVFFFDANTTTPKVTYKDGGLDIAHDHPVVANGFGRFPAIFMEGAPYRVRIETADGVTIEDIDNIAIPALSDDSGGGGGDTPITLLARTGDLKFRYGTGAHSGWVRCAGRTIGNPLSGATERANDDCENLFEYLWTADPNLTVSGGRGASAAGDWAAGKTIQLPDFRNRAIFGLGDMGNTNAALIANTLFDEGDNITLGSDGGEDEVTLTVAQMPSHNHTGTTTTNGNHNHTFQTDQSSGGSRIARGRGGVPSTATTSTDGNHSHSLNINNRGGGEAHTNMPPFRLATIYIKL